MDEGGDENSVDSLDAFDLYDDDVELSDINAADEEDGYGVTSNSSSSHQDYSSEFNSDNDDNDSQLTDGSVVQPLVEMLEENNNDPNNNMEGGEGNQADEFRPMVELPVSPQPGCSKDYPANVDGASSAVNRAAVRIQTFLHNITCTKIASILRQRPNFEYEVNNLFKKYDNEASLKRTHDGHDICDIEKKRVTTIQLASVNKPTNEMEKIHQTPVPEAVRDGAPVVAEQAQELTPPGHQDQHVQIYTLKNDTPIRIDSSDDDDYVANEDVKLPLRKKRVIKFAGKDVRGYELGMPQGPMFQNWRDSSKASTNNGISEKVNIGARPTSKVKTAPATIVREEQATTRTAGTMPTNNPVHAQKRGDREAHAGSSQNQRPMHSPIRSGHVMIDEVPTKIKIVTNGSRSRIVPVGNYHRPLPQELVQPPRLHVPQHQSRGTHLPPTPIEPQPGSSTSNHRDRPNPSNALPLPYNNPAKFEKQPALNLQDQLQRDLQEADRQIAERINYRMRQDAEERRGHRNDHIPPRSTVTQPPPRPERNIPPLPHVPVPAHAPPAAPSQIPLVHVDDGRDNLFPQKNNGEYCREIYTKLRAMFPNIKKGYIKRITPASWTPNVGHDVQFGQIVERLLANEDSWELEIVNEEPEDLRGAAGNVRTVDETYEHLLGIFPDADPTFLRDAAEKRYNDDQGLEQFIEQHLQTHNYPTREEYLSKMRITEEQLRYTTKFTVPEFLEKFPEPVKHFMDKKRKCKHSTVGLEFLKSHFNRIRVNTVSKVYNEAQSNMSIAAARLREIGSDMGSTRKSSEIPTEDINMLQEMAFIRHENEIKTYIDDMKQAEKAEFEKLKNSNDLLECQCCYDDECMPSKCSACDQGHVFCNSCIIKGTDTKLGEGETHVPCFQACGAEFSLATLQDILKPTKFSILVKKRQAAEVAAAGLEGLVSCPFCHFASIPPEGDKVFKCLNPECMKESCIQCKEPNHVPLRCDEVGKVDKARKYIEEKMTEALARKCYSCKKAYFKEEGCNKITCPCGAIMCYLCDKKIKNYSHFRGQGSDDMRKCPLYSDNAVLNAETVRRVADEAKRELLRQDPSLNIETDHLLPTVPPPSAGPHQQILQAPHMQAPPMQAHHMQAPPMQAHHMQAPPMQAQHMQAPQMQLAQAAQVVHAMHQRLLAQQPRHVHNRP